MPKSFLLLLAFGVVPVAFAQSGATQSLATQSPAPIVRSDPNPGAANSYPGGLQVANSSPIPGVLLRVPAGSSVQTVSADAKGTELRVNSGRVNVNVHHPEQNVQILVDLPGGQVDLLKDGLYTFNADTGTVRVLKGEAEAFADSAAANAKPLKIKEEQQLSFAAAGHALRPEDAAPNQLTADLLPPNNNGQPRASNYGDSLRYESRYAPYAGGFYGFPYAAYGFPYGYGYPYGIGLGFGYYGGFGYGGFGRFGGFRR